jgi:dihydroorotase-like cyclic amidohydrolase
MYRAKWCNLVCVFGELRGMLALSVVVDVTAFVDVDVVPMDTERVLPNQTVLVEGGRIIALGPSRQVQVPAGASRIDGRGQYLLPGLANMHVHLNQAVSAKVERAFFKWLVRGITPVRVMDWKASPSQSEVTLQLRARAAVGELWSPRIDATGN